MTKKYKCMRHKTKYQSSNYSKIKKSNNQGFKYFLELPFIKEAH